MKWQSLFCGKNNENIINLSSAELTQRVVKVKLLILGWHLTFVRQGQHFFPVYLYKEMLKTTTFLFFKNVWKTDGLKPAICDGSRKPFSYNQKGSSQGVVYPYPCPWAIYMYKLMESLNDFPFEIDLTISKKFLSIWGESVFDLSGLIQQTTN